MIKRFLMLVPLLFLASCVPTQDLIYLQGEPVKKNEVSKLNDMPYKLQVHDVLAITIKTNDPDSEQLVSLFDKSKSNAQTNNQDINTYENSNGYKYGYSVDRNGNIRLPILGEMNVLGYTTKEVRIKVEDALLKDYIKSKEKFFVTVILSGIKYNITGEVNNPGPRVINQNRVNIFEAISNAGDITTIGNRKKVVLWRSSITGMKKYTIDLTKATAFDSEIFYIHPNDFIYVLPLNQKSWGTGSTGLQSLTTIVSVMSLITSTILIMRNL